MLTSLDDVSKLIAEGALLHIAGAEALLRKLPKGNWVGGSTEYFMDAYGGKMSGELLSVIKLPYEEFTIKSYGEDTVHSVATDAFDNGFSIVAIPFDSTVHKVYAEKAPGFDDMFMKNIVGWITGINLAKPGQTPVSVNGQTGEVFTDRAAVMHIGVPAEKTVTIGVINIFSQDEGSPVIEFSESGFSVAKCLVNGEEKALAQYIADTDLDPKLPLVGDYSGNGVNVSIKSVDGDNGIVNFYAPVFSGIKYRIAKNVPDYAAEFRSHISDFSDTGSVFSCNCILNFLYGELEGKVIEPFFGPITFGEIAYQLVNQTLVYVSVSDLQ